jgi:hypothetical protein
MWIDRLIDKMHELNSGDRKNISNKISCQVKLKIMNQVKYNQDGTESMA